MNLKTYSNITYMWNMTIQSNVSTAELHITGYTLKELADKYSATTGRNITPYTLGNISLGRRKDTYITLSKVTNGNLTIS